MCNHCGCSAEKALISDPETGKHTHLHMDGNSLKLQESLLAGNTALAEKNRHWFKQNHVLSINLMGTPGAGKTALLEATLLSPEFSNIEISVLEGDQQTSNDAKRIRSAGAEVLQINTGTGCHLDAEMIQTGVESIQPKPGSLLFIENVGNLVCPALFDLGEHLRVTMMAVTDGADKPEKYPHMFSNCDLVLINKADLLPYIDFDLDYAKNCIAKLNPNVKVIVLAANKQDEAMQEWQEWLMSGLKETANESLNKPQNQAELANA